jgi:hypothetical protein
MKARLGKIRGRVYRGGKRTGKTAVSGHFRETEKRKGSEILRFQNLSGGDKEDRTPDLLNAIQALSQLSYTPENAHYNSKYNRKCQGLFFRNFN